jgi:hypothetical protein
MLIVTGKIFIKEVLFNINKSFRTNPFERETPFRQSISEKRRVTHQPNKQAIQWKQRSFHEGRTQNERSKPYRFYLDSYENKRCKSLRRNTV